MPFGKKINVLETCSTKEKLAFLSQYLQDVAIGRIHEHLPVPEKENEFSELIVTINLVIDDFEDFKSANKERAQELEKLNEELFAAVALRSKEVQEQSAMYRALFESSRDAIQILEPPNWNFTSCNLATVKLFGVKNEKEFIILPPSDVSPEKQADGRLSSDKAKEMIAKAMKEGVNYFEWIHKKINGQNFYASVLLSKVKVGSHEFLQATVRDISERRKIDEEMRINNEILKNISEGIYLIRVSDGKIISANEKFEQMFGYKHGELLGKEVSIVNAPTKEKTPEETKESILDIILKTGEWHGEVENIKKDGTTFWCFADVSLFEHPVHGKVLVAVHDDITEQKEKRDDMERMNKLMVGRELKMIEMKLKIKELQELLKNKRS